MHFYLSSFSGILFVSVHIKEFCVIFFSSLFPYESLNNVFLSWSHVFCSCTLSNTSLLHQEFWYQLTEWRLYWNLSDEVGWSVFASFSHKPLSMWSSATKPCILSQTLLDSGGYLHALWLGYFTGELWYHLLLYCVSNILISWFDIPHLLFFLPTVIHCYFLVQSSQQTSIFICHFRLPCIGLFNLFCFPSPCPTHFKSFSITPTQYSCKPSLWFCLSINQ